MDATLLAALPAAVHAEFARRGITCEQVAALVCAEPDDVVLLAGSYATGEANPTSDLDILVLTRDTAPRRVEGTTNHPSIFGDSFDAMANDLLVNIEYVHEDHLQQVQRAVRPPAPGEPPDMANLQALELRLIQRVSIGVPLANEERLEKLRAGVDEPLVRAGAAALAFVDAMSLLGDTLVLSSPDREVMRRGGAEFLLMAGINAFGRITYDLKHMLSRARTLATQHGMPSLFARSDEVVFADRLEQDAGLALLLDLAEELFRSFTDPRCPPAIRPMLEPFRPQWAWTERTF